MEGLEGIALAGNVIQFVQFASDFVSKVQGYIYGGLLVAESAAERHFAAQCRPCPQRPEISAEFTGGVAAGLGL